MNGAYQIIENEHGKFAIARSGHKFMVAKWNPHHQNWVRANRHEGGGVHRNIETLATDNLGGGPVLMTLREARELVADGMFTGRETYAR